MKGLLIKDLRLMKVQKNFFFIFIVIAIGMGAFSYNISFMVGFLSFVLSLFTLSTISYDEFYLHCRLAAQAIPLKNIVLLFCLGAAHGFLRQF